MSEIKPGSLLRIRGVRTNAVIAAERDALREQIGRVRALHVRQEYAAREAIMHGNFVMVEGRGPAVLCGYCARRWPCRTIAALTLTTDREDHP